MSARTERVLLIVGHALAYTALSFTGLAMGSMAVEVHRASVAAPQIEEDEPGWDCRTMGNRTCGPDSNAPAGRYNSDGDIVEPWSDGMNLPAPTTSKAKPAPAGDTYPNGVHENDVPCPDGYHGSYDEPWLASPYVDKS